MGCCASTEVPLNKPMSVDYDITQEGKWPLPGVSTIDLSYNLETDLKHLQSTYKNVFKQLLTQEFVVADDSKKDMNPNETITMIQLNMLSDALSTGYERSAANNKGFVGVDKTCLRWTYRGLRLIELATKYKPDILTIEEMDQRDYFVKYLEPMGYECHFQPKSTSPTRHVGKSIAMERNMKESDYEKLGVHRDGIFIAFRKDKFERSSGVSIQEIKPRDNEAEVVALAVPLYWKAKGINLWVLSTHLKSKKSDEGETIRVEQVKSLFGDLFKNDGDWPVIVGCDLNANPVKNKKGYEPLAYTEVTTTYEYKSAYSLALGSEPEYTTWKQREHGVDKHTIDYIFLHGKDWKVSHILSIPDSSASSETSKALIPNWHYPSDHFALGCKICWDSK